MMNGVREYSTVFHVGMKRLHPQLLSSLAQSSSSDSIPGASLTKSKCWQSGDYRRNKKCLILAINNTLQRLKIVLKEIYKY